MMTSPRIKTTNGQLRPLRRRMSPQEYMKRNDRVAARAYVADQLVNMNRRVALYAASHIQRGFFGRLRWLFFGR